MTKKFELDHAKDSGTKALYFIIHGPLPKGLNADPYGYPICDSMNRHHCISPAEDQANGEMIVKVLNGYNTLLIELSAIADFAVGHGDVCEIIARRARAAIRQAEGNGD